MTRRERALAIAVQDAAAASNTPPATKLRRWVKRAIGPDVHGELTLRIVDADESAALNSRYRAKRGPTNVLSFAAAPSHVASDELLPIGDVVICAEVVEREAREQGKALDAHWAHMVVHGALHLQGYDHETPAEAKIMESRERAVLAELGFPDPYSV